MQMEELFDKAKTIREGIERITARFERNPHLLTQIWTTSTESLLEELLLPDTDLRGKFHEIAHEVRDAELVLTEAQYESYISNLESAIQRVFTSLTDDYIKGELNTLFGRT